MKLTSFGGVFFTPLSNINVADIGASVNMASIISSHLGGWWWCQSCGCAFVGYIISVTCLFLLVGMKSGSQAVWAFVSVSKNSTRFLKAVDFWLDAWDMILAIIIMANRWVTYREHSGTDQSAGVGSLWIFLPTGAFALSLLEQCILQILWEKLGEHQVYTLLCL